MPGRPPRGGRARSTRARNGRRPFLGQVVPDREAARHDVLGREQRLLEPERLQEKLVPDFSQYHLAGHDLDDAPGEVETGVVVRPQLAERRQLRQAYEVGDHALERVVARPVVGEVVAHPARCGSGDAAS